MLIMSDLVIIVSKRRNMTIINDLNIIKKKTVSVISWCGFNDLTTMHLEFIKCNPVVILNRKHMLTLMSQYPFLLLPVSFHSPTSPIQLPLLPSLSACLSWDVPSWRCAVGCFIIRSSHLICSPGCGDIWHTARAPLPDIFIRGAEPKRQLSGFGAGRHRREASRPFGKVTTPW